MLFVCREVAASRTISRDKGVCNYLQTHSRAFVRTRHQTRFYAVLFLPSVVTAFRFHSREHQRASHQLPLLHGHSGVLSLPVDGPSDHKIRSKPAYIKQYSMTSMNRGKGET